MIIGRDVLYLSGVSLLALMPAPGLAAQVAPGDVPAATPAPAPGQPQELSDIVVTAQKRAQNLQAVPVAVTALTSETLQASRITNVASLSGLAPGLTARQSVGVSGIAQFSMRGITSGGAVPGSERETSIYLDGVYLGTARASLFELPDVERIEVLRGPQGTLFGRNSTAGAVSIVTRNPTGRFGVQQDLTLGNYRRFRSRTSVDLPSAGPLSGYVTYIHNERRGDVRNTGAGTVWDRTGPNSSIGKQVSPKYLGDHDVNTWFAALKFDSGDAFTAIYKFDRTVDNFTPDAEFPLYINPRSPGLGPVIAAVIATQTTPVTINTDARRVSSVNNGWAVPARQTNMGHNLTIDLDLAPRLKLRNVASYRRSSIFGAGQLSGLGGLEITAGTAALFPSFAPVVGRRFLVTESASRAISKQWSDEIQLNYDSALLTLTAGGIWFHSKDQIGGAPNIQNTFAGATIPASGLIPLGNEGTSFNRSTSLGAYAQTEVHVTPVIDIVGGMRITRDKKSGIFVSGGSFLSSVPGCPAVNPSSECRTEGTFVGQKFASFTYDKSKPTFSLGVNYTPRAGLLAYGKYATGFVSGGSIGGMDWRPESVRSYEVGLKADWLDRRLRTNLALWYADYSKVQAAQAGFSVGRPELGTVIITGFDNKSRGVEFEATALPVDGLTLTASMAYTSVRLSNVNPILLASVAAAPLQSTATRYLPILSPTWTSNLSAQYESLPLAGDVTGLARLDAVWRSRVRSDANPDRATFYPGWLDSSPPRWLVNARLALRHLPIGSARGEIALWSRNLFDSRVPVYPLALGSYALATTFEEARTWGLDLQVKF